MGGVYSSKGEMDLGPFQANAKSWVSLLEVADGNTLVSSMRKMFEIRNKNHESYYFCQHVNRWSPPLNTI